MSVLMLEKWLTVKREIKILLHFIVQWLLKEAFVHLQFVVLVCIYVITVKYCCPLT